jgi:prolipoprotein diacylglyceryltransferase
VRLRSRGASDRVVLGTYFLLAGALRFAIEFIRINERVVGNLSVAHLASLAIAIAGAVMLATARRGTAPVRT